MLRYRKNHPMDITVDDLVEMDTALLEYHKAFERTIAPLMPSKGQTIKYHRLSHVTDSIRRHGHLREMHAQFFEGSNKEEKASYKTTTGRFTDDQHLEGMVTNQKMRRALEKKSTMNQDEVIQSRKSAYLTAAESGNNTLTKTELFTLDTLGKSEIMSSEAKSFIQGYSDWDDILHSIKRYCKASALDDEAMPIIKPRSTGVICATVPWLPSDSNELQTVRATPSFFKRPYFDSVMYGYSHGGRSLRRYGQLRLLFECFNRRTMHCEKLVCLKLYKKTNQTDILSERFGCTHLEFATPAHDVSDPGRGLYQVIPFDRILRRVYIVPDFSKSTDDKDYFHLSTFKWNRTPIDV